jgi:uncharacterized protein
MKQLFPIIFVLFFAIAHYFIYIRMVIPSHFKTKTKQFLKLLLVANFILVISYFGVRYFVDAPLWLHFLSSLSIGIGFVFFLGSLLHEVFLLFYKQIPMQPNRRAFVRKIGDIGFWSLGSVYVGAAVNEGAHEPTVVPVCITTKRLRKSYRFVQLSDMHIGGLVGEEFVRKCVERVNAMSVDAVFITGDLVDTDIDRIKTAIAHLGNLKSRLGVFMIVGNHEYFHGIEKTIAFVRSLGIKVLCNEALEIEEFWLVGVNDLFGLRAGYFEPDIKRAAGFITNDKPTLLLAHQPKFIKHLEGFEPDVALCGHTHGGQIFPFHFLVRLDQPYLKGLHRQGRTQIYVNSGIGFWGPPMRLGSSAEITLIEWKG